MVIKSAREDTTLTVLPNGNRTFQRLLGASTVSMLGSHLTTIAYPLLVLRLTGSAFIAGCVVFAAAVPSIFAYMPAGALVDRWNPRRAMVVSEIGRGMAIGAVAVTLAIGKSMVPLLMAVAVIEGILEVFSGLAERRYVGSLLERGQLPSALVRIEARAHFVVVAGRPLGGLLFGIGPILPFLADVASFIYSATTLLGLKRSERAEKVVVPARAALPRESLVTDVRQGLRWICADRFARMAIVSFSVGTLLFQALIIVFLGDAHSRQLPGLAIGTVLAASGVGGALGSAAASRLLPKAGCYWMQVQASIWVVGFSLLILPVGRPLLATAIVMAALGFTGAVGNIALDTHITQRTAPEILARVTSVARLASFTAYAIGPVMGGLLVREFGAQPALLCLFCLAPALVVLSTRLPSGLRWPR
jgi:MFS family permease